MPIDFKWSGKTIQGAVQDGVMTANSKEEVMAYLRKKKITPTVIKEKDKSKGFSFSGSFGGKVTTKDLVIFTRQFATMIDAGLPLVQALEILSQQTENRFFGKIIGEIKGDIEGGSTYADALKKHPKIFDNLYINMVAAGETGGILDTILNRLCQYIEKAMKLKKKIKGAMIYPSTIVTVAVAVIAVIVIFVVPIFAKMFAQLGGVLPLPTRMIIGLSDFLGGIGGLMILGTIIAFVVGIKQARKSEKGLKVTDSIMLKLPIFGLLLRKVAVAKFTRTLGTLISSGVPLLEGLDITAKTAGNKVVELAVYDIKQSVSEGSTLAEPLVKTATFPPMVNQMIAVGEQTGALDNMLGKIADFYDEEVDNTVNNLTALMEPFIMVFLGGAIGFIVVAMYLPIFKLLTLVT
jgi:type IV pilus assembly protein PilC